METHMKSDPQLLPIQPRIQSVDSVDGPIGRSTQVVFTRDHDVIMRWAGERQARPATGEETESGPATVSVKDGGAGVRFNFPGVGVFRPISWDEWFTNFDRHQCAFVYENDAAKPISNRYRIVKADDWKDLLS
jgi:hypothetical protein